MIGESANSQKVLLAAAVAEGTAVAKWAATNEVPERTAYRWAAEPEVRSEIESIRRRAAVFVKQSRIRGGKQSDVRSKDRIVTASPKPRRQARVTEVLVEQHLHSCAGPMRPRARSLAAS
jgi:hypothetical protein